MQSNDINKLAEALAKAQRDMKVAVKGAENPFFKSHYADLPAIRTACVECLSTNGLSVSQITQFEGESIWLETILMHSSGQWLMGRYPIRPVKNDPQGVGSAISYARRYSLMAMVGVVADDGSDDDGNAASGRTSPTPSKESAPVANPKTLATQWAKEAEETIRGFKTLAELEEWQHQNNPKIYRVRDNVETAHARLMDAIRKRAAELSTLNAG